MAEELSVRINFRVTIAEYPILTETLLRVPKGPPRSRRLAQLAYLGAMIERIGIAAIGPARPTSGPTVTANGHVGSARSDSPPTAGLDDADLDALFGTDDAHNDA